MTKSMQMDIIDFVTAEVDPESCSGTDLDNEKESDDSDIDYLSDNKPQIQFVHSQQVQCTTNDTDDDGISNVNKANVNDDNNAGLVQGDSARYDQFENNDDDEIISDEDTPRTRKSSSIPQAKKQRVRSSDSSSDNDNDEEEVATPQHSGGHVAVDNRAGCRHVWTRGRPVHRQGLHRRGGVHTRGGGGRVPVHGSVLAERGRGGGVAGEDAWTWEQINVGEQVQMEDFQFNENE